MDYMYTIQILFFKICDYLILIIYLEKLKQQTEFSLFLGELIIALSNLEFELKYIVLTFCNLQK